MSKRTAVIGQRKKIALIAHDHKKPDLLEWVKFNKGTLLQHELFATGTTGKLLEQEIGAKITTFESGPLGGDQQIGSLVASGEIQAVMFLRDPLMAHPHEPDVSALLRVCDVHNIPLATNLASAEAVLHLLFDHPQAMGGHHVIAQSISDKAAVNV